MGRAFALRDRGELDEALDSCREAIRVAGGVDPAAPNASAFGTMIVGATTIDEIARKLGRPEIARQPLEQALLLLESANRRPPPSDELIRTEREVRARLEELRAAD